MQVIAVGDSVGESVLSIGTGGGRGILRRRVTESPTRNIKHCTQLLVRRLQVQSRLCHMARRYAGYNRYVGGGSRCGVYV